MHATAFQSFHDLRVGKTVVVFPTAADYGERWLGDVEERRGSAGSAAMMAKIPVRRRGPRSSGLIASLPASPDRRSAEWNSSVHPPETQGSDRSR